MSPSLNVLIVEDSSRDAELLVRELDRAGLDCGCTRVETEADFRTALDASPDLILSDYSLPQFDGIRAFEVMRDNGFDIPFILVSGTVGEDVAVEAMRMGVTDYLLKDRLGRLGAAVRRALELAQLQRERRLADELLSISEKRYRRLFESAKDGILIVNAETGLIEDVNPFLTELLAYSKEEFLSKNIWDIGVFRHFFYSQSAFRELQQNDYVRYEELSLESGDGRRLDVMFASNVYEVDGVKVIQCNIRDISERVRAEAESKRRHDELQLILDTVPAIIFYKDREGRFLRVNRELSQVLGISPEAFVGKTASEMGGPNGENYHRDDLHVMKTGIPLRQVEEILHTPRGELNLLTDILPLRDATGRITGVIGLAVDITRRKRAEESIRRSENLLRIQDRAMHAASQGIVITDALQPDHPIIYVNRGFESITGYSPDDAIGHSCRFLQGPDTDARSVVAIREAIDNARPVTIELLNYRKDGKTFWNKLSITPVRDDAGEVTHFVGIQSDVTAHRNTEEQLRQSQKMDAVGYLAGGVAHDFNNLLTVIDGYTEILLDQLSTDARNCGFLKEIQIASTRAADLTTGLLAFSHRQFRTPESLNLNEPITETLKLLERLLGENIELDLSLAPGLSPIWADRGQISQILMNLVINARDATRGRGRISIRTQNIKLTVAKLLMSGSAEPGDYVLMSVKDNGCGISKTDLSRIFEPFFTKKAVGKGTGLGLAIIHGIVAQCEGFIEVSSKVGKGSTFQIIFPALREAVEQRQAASIAKKPSAGSETVLLVEDDSAVRQLARIALASYGYNVLEAANGTEALKCFSIHAKSIALIVTDIAMPGMNGMELVRRLVAEKPAIRVLFTSGYVADKEARERFVDADLNFLPKPFNVQALASKVREVLDT